ncbi:MAG: hypothetical protein H7257_14735 [Taibaiella sp.]|nr:hypothetical protein [Taibaiella sp.]
MKKVVFTFLAASVFLGACKKKDSNTTPVTPTSYELSGDISSDMTLDASHKYTLKGFVFVKSGATLHIPAGTVIVGDKASKGTLVITRGGKIDAQGTVDKPIVFTSAQPVGARREADWGGVILLGKAPINPAGGEAKIEGGLTATGGGDEKTYIWYGGSDAADNSGVIKYVRIEFAGIAFSPDNEINGLTLGGVGSGTTVSYVQVYRSGDDAYEWFGGTVNCDHLMATYSWDDDWDTDFGYSGRVQFGVSQRYKAIADQSGSNGFESDNDANGSTNTPQTKAVFCNMTVIGPIATSGNSGINPSFQHGAQLRRNSSISIFNSIIIGFPIGLYIDNTKGTATSGNLTAGTLQLKNNIFTGNTIKYKSEFSGLDSVWMATNGNTFLATSPDAKLVDPYKYAPSVGTSAGRPNYLLQSSSPAVTGASFTGLPSTFTSVTYRGAFDASNDWTTTWATFDAENNAY